MRPPRLTNTERQRLRRELAGEDSTYAVEQLIRRSAEALGVLTGELGIAVAPRLGEAVLEKLELVSASSEKVLLVLTLRGGLVRTVYVDLPFTVPPEALVSLTLALNERLHGQTLPEIRNTLRERLKEASSPADTHSHDFINIFIQSADDIFELKDYRRESVHLGRTSVLANQPEFSSGSRLKELLELTERRDLLASVLGDREHETSLTITIGGEHAQPELSGFTVVTSEYTMGNLSGVIGVIGPTRMPYEKVVAIVGGTSAILKGLLESGESSGR
ncbi:MAG TPA: HrcA family transcriptional regulator [Longimicrobiales bacterium]|nr:HrcA family transcriptional regulator [Longimicrobiales bacterium]